MTTSIENSNLEIYKLFFDGAADAFFLAGLDGKIFEVNAAAAGMLGYTKEEIYKLGREGIIDTSDPNLVLLLEERIKSGKYAGQLNFKRKNGAIFPAEVSSHVVQLKNGEVRTCIVARDSTQKKINQLLYNETAELNKKILKNAPVGIATYNNEGKCLYVNDYYASAVGASRTELLTQNFRELASWRFYGLFTLAEIALNEGTEVHKEINYVTTFGRNLWLDITFVRFYSYGEPNLLLMARDITTKKRIEEELFKVGQELKRLNETRDNLLLWALNESGQMDFKPEKFDLKEITDSLLLLLIPSANEKNITLYVGKHINESVYADKNMIKTVLRNLVSNAIKFTNKLGDIFINFDLEQEFVKVSVTDNGVGMTKNKLNKILNSDEKLSKLGKHNMPENGYGLIICKELIEKNKGTFKIESAEGKGSTFSFTVPVYKRLN